MQWVSVYFEIPFQLYTEFNSSSTRLNNTLKYQKYSSIKFVWGFQRFIYEQFTIYDQNLPPLPSLIIAKLYADIRNGNLINPLGMGYND